MIMFYACWTQKSDTFRWWVAVTGPRYGLKFAINEHDIPNCMKKKQPSLFLFHSIVAYPGPEKTVVKYDFGPSNNDVATKEQKKISEETEVKLQHPDKMLFLLAGVAHL